MFLVNGRVYLIALKPLVISIEILDFDCFKSDLLTPDNYVEQAKDLFDATGEANRCPPYMVIYETLHNICTEQRNIVDNGVDVTDLSSTLGALP